MAEGADAGFRLMALRLFRVQFEVLGDLDDVEGMDVKNNVAIGARRIGEDLFGIEFGYSVDHTGVVKSEVVYRAEFRDLAIVEEGVVGKELEERWRIFASRIGPTVVYPYARQITSQLMDGAGLPPLYAPVLNFAQLFDPDEVSIDEFAEFENQPDATESND